MSASMSETHAMSSAVGLKQKLSVLESGSCELGCHGIVVLAVAFHSTSPPSCWSAARRVDPMADALISQMVIVMVLVLILFGSGALNAVGAHHHRHHHHHHQCPRCIDVASSSLRLL
jgi:hypothetical protein